MLIKKLRVSEYRGHSNLTLELDQLSILVGRNNVGKSSVIQAIQLLSQAARYQPLKFPAQGFFAFSSAARSGGSGHISFAVDLEPSASEQANLEHVHYELELAAPDPSSGRASIRSEKLEVGGTTLLIRDPSGVLSGQFSHLIQAAALSDETVASTTIFAMLPLMRSAGVSYANDSLKVASQLLRRSGQYRLIPFKVTEPGQDPITSESSYCPEIQQNGSGTVDVLAWLNHHAPARLASIQAALAIAVDGVRGFDFRPDSQNPNLIELFVIFDDNRGAQPATSLSDGARNLLGLLTVVLSETFFPMTCFEEPEIGLTPVAIEVFAQKLLESLKPPSRKQQVVLSTHSPFILESIDKLASHAGGPGVQNSISVISRNDSSGETGSISARTAIDRDPSLGPMVREMDAVDWAELLRRL